MRFGTKSVVVKDGKILLIKRSSYDNYNSGEWDMPGGRIEDGEGIFDGHKREVFEETKLKIDIIEPIRCWAVDRLDGKHVGITFLSKYLDGDIILSNEHTEHKWLSPDKVQKTDAAQWIKEEVAKAVEINPPLFAKAASNKFSEVLLDKSKPL